MSARRLPSAVAPLALDFIAPSPRRLRRQRAAWALALLLALALAGVARQAGRLATELEAADTRAALRDAREAARSGGRRGDRSADPALQARVAQANALIDELAVPWPALFTSLEAAAVPGVALTGVVPDARTGLLRVSGEAPSLPVLLAYVQRLGGQPGLHQVQLRGWDTPGREGASPLSFTVEALWQKP